LSNTVLFAYTVRVCEDVWVTDAVALMVCVCVVDGDIVAEGEDDCEGVEDCVGDCDSVEDGEHAILRARSHMLANSGAAAKDAPDDADRSGTTASPVFGTGWCKGTLSEGKYHETGVDALHVSRTLDALVVLTIRFVPSDRKK
jgi:hypothetical protein